MHRYFIQLAYHGAAYHGWQSQANAHSVQDELEKCFRLKLRQHISITGCGRTDTGVHARDYYAHFDSHEPFSDCRQLTDELNQFLPPDIVLRRIIPVAADAHARFDAIERTYHYHISREKNPFSTQTSWYVYGKLDVDAMQEAAALILQFEDFTSFCKLHSQTSNNLCKVTAGYWMQSGESLVFVITANRFLRNMVRAIVGTLVMVGRQKISVTDFQHIIASMDRSKAGMSAPPQGLFLESVRYPDTVFLAEASAVIQQ